MWSLSQTLGCYQHARTCQLFWCDVRCDGREGETQIHGSPAALYHQQPDNMYNHIVDDKKTLWTYHIIIFSPDHPLDLAGVLFYKAGANGVYFAAGRRSA